MKNLYYFTLVNENIIKKYDFKRYLDNLHILKTYEKRLIFDKQNIILNTNKKELNIRTFLNCVNQFLEKTNVFNFNSNKYVTLLYLRQQYNFINYNFDLSKKKLNKICNDINNTIINF